MWQALLGAAIAGGSSALAYDQTREINDERINLSHEQMRWEEQMSNTAYQRAVADMRAADINPMLAYMRGGASTPTYQTPVLDNPAVAAQNASSGAYEAMRKVAETKNIEALTEKTKADTAVSEQAVLKGAAEARLANASASAAEYQVEKILPWRAYQAPHEASQEETKAAKGAIETRIARDTAEAEIARKKAESSVASGTEEARIRQAVAEALAAEYELPGMRNQMAVDESDYGRNVRPYLKDAAIGGDVLSSAAGASVKLGTLKRLFRYLK